MQSEELNSPNRKYSTMLASAQIIMKNNGFGGFFKGYIPCVVRALPVNSSVFLVYENVRGYLTKREESRRSKI